jgi:hypothetical protein
VESRRAKYLTVKSEVWIEIVASAGKARLLILVGSDGSFREYVSVQYCRTRSSFNPSSVFPLGSISPGCGCNEERVDEIVDELRKRIRERGDVAQLHRTEQTLKRLDEMEKKIDMIMEAVKIPAGEKMRNRE